MKKNIAIIGFLFVFTYGFSQKKTTNRIDSTLLKSNKIDLFDYDIFKRKNKSKTITNNSKTEEKVKANMPVFIPEGNYKLRVVKIDTLKKYSLRVYKIE